MKTNTTLAVLAIVALLLSGCGSTPTPTAYIIPLTGDQSIGKINAEEKLVESGPSSNLIPVSQNKDFFNNDTIRVTNGGIARLDFFVNQISIRLFNDTAVDGVKADPAGTPNGYVRMKLVFGGLSGEVTKNGVPVHFEVTSGVNIYVLGTQFLVLYDPETGTTYVANFDGTIAYSIPGQSVQFTEAGQLYEISPSFAIERQPLTFTRAEIENLTSSRRSTLLDSLNDLELTATVTPTVTPIIIPTASPTSSPTITPTSTRMIPCNQAAFVADVTIPDGTTFSPGVQFTKVWRLRNVGSCTWTTGYSLIFYRGEQMAGSSINIPSAVAPGQTIDVAVNLVAPTLPGSYRGDWMLMNPSGALFGVGVSGTTPFWVKIIVTGLSDLTTRLTSGPTVSCSSNATTVCINVTSVGFVITNTSNVDVTNSFQILIEATGLTPKTIPINGLAAGASQNFNEQLAGSCFIVNQDCTARVTVDFGNTILESTEANNVAETTAVGIRPGTITGIAFADANADRIFNSGEQVIQGITVAIYDGNGNAVLPSTTTNTNGGYTFANLSPGTYVVRWSENNCQGTPVPRQATIILNADATQINNIPQPICIS